MDHRVSFAQICYFHLKMCDKDSISKKNVADQSAYAQLYKKDN